MCLITYLSSRNHANCKALVSISSVYLFIIKNILVEQMPPTPVWMLHFWFVHVHFPASSSKTDLTLWLPSWFPFQNQLSSNVLIHLDVDWIFCNKNSSTCFSHSNNLLPQPLELVEWKYHTLSCIFFVRDYDSSTRYNDRVLRHRDAIWEFWKKKYRKERKRGKYRFHDTDLPSQREMFLLLRWHLILNLAQNMILCCSLPWISTN